MALAYEVEIAESSTTDYGAGSFTTAAFTPPNSSLLVLVVAASYSDTLTTNFSTPVGGSLTWTQRLAINDNGGADGRLEVWTAPVTTGASMTVAVDHPDAVVGVWHVTVLSFTDYDTATPTGVTATGTPTSSGTGALTLSGTPAASSYVIAARQGNTNGGLLIATPGSGWTELADLAVNSFGGLEVQIKSGGSSAVVWTEINVNGVDDVGRCTLAIEIKAATGGGEGASQGPGIVIGGSSSFVGEGAIGAPEGAAAAVLSAAAGSYVITGTAATLKYGRKIAGAAGSYTITGTAASLEYGFKVAAASGSYAVTGQAASFLTTRVLAAVPGSYSISGTATSLEYGRKLAASSGAYNITGTDATLIYTPVGAITLAAVSGSYAFSGTSANLIYGRALAAESGSYVLTGTASSVEYGRVLIGVSGAYALTGAAAQLIKSARTLTAAPGSYQLSGQAASMVITAAPVVPGRGGVTRFRPLAYG